VVFWQLTIDANDPALYEIGLAVGVGRKSRVSEGQPQPWAWLRLPDSSSFAKVAQPIVERMRSGETSRDREGLWLPLRLPAGEPGSVMIKEVRAEIETIGTAIREAIDHAVETELDRVPVEHKRSVTAVLGMPTIDPADLLDDSPARMADIELLLREAARSFYDGRIWPKVRDSDYDFNRYIPVTPMGAYISTSMDRQTSDADNSPQPWAWLRVHEVTANAAIAYQVLERIAPGRVVVDSHGRAIPFDIPADAQGPRMLEAVRDQIQRAMIGIREAVRAHHASARQGPDVSAQPSRERPLPNLRRSSRGHRMDGRFLSLSWDVRLSACAVVLCDLPPSRWRNGLRVRVGRRYSARAGPDRIVVWGWNIGHTQ